MFQQSSGTIIDEFLADNLFLELSNNLYDMASGQSFNFFFDRRNFTSANGIHISPTLRTIENTARYFDKPLSYFLAAICKDYDYLYTVRDKSFCENECGITRCDIFYYVRDMSRYVRSNRLESEAHLKAYSNCSIRDHLKAYSNCSIRDTSGNLIFLFYNNSTSRANIRLDTFWKGSRQLDENICDMLLKILYYRDTGLLPIDSRANIRLDTFWKGSRQLDENICDMLLKVLYYRDTGLLPIDNEDYLGYKYSGFPKWTKVKNICSEIAAKKKFEDILHRL